LKVGRDARDFPGPCNEHDRPDGWGASSDTGSSCPLLDERSSLQPQTEKTSWEAANVCLQTHGGFGFAAEYDIERKFRETRLYLVAPISTNLILSYIAEHVLGLPRSF